MHFAVGINEWKQKTSDKGQVVPFISCPVLSKEHRLRNTSYKSIFLSFFLRNQLYTGASL